MGTGLNASTLKRGRDTGPRGARLDQIPEIAIQAFEDGDRPVAGDEGWSHEPDTGVGHGAIVPPEVVRAQKEPDAATRLVFDERLLLWPRRPANLDSMSHPELR